MDRRYLTYACALVLVALLVACKPSNRKLFSKPEDFERYASLPALSATHHPELKAELSRLIAERATPTQIDAWSSALRMPNQVAASTRRKETAAADALQEIFPLEIRTSLSKHFAALYPGPGLRFAPLMRRPAAEFRRSSDERRLAYHRLILADDLLPVHVHAHGLGADTSYIDAVELGNKLEAIYIAELVNAGQLASVREPLAVMTRAVEWMAQEHHPLPRSAAAQRRAELLALVGGLASHPNCDSETREWLLDLVAGQLERWPPDANAWIGERVQGLHTYELVRDGHLLSLLSFEDLRKYREELGIENLGLAVSQNLDEDELFYLGTMRKVIDACSRPYYQRQQVFQELHENLEQLRSSDAYPFVADQILLGSMQNGQRLQALDRARCSAWYIALRVACGHELGREEINPLTGEAFSVGQSASGCTICSVDPTDPESDITVPRMSANP